MRALALALVLLVTACSTADGGTGVDAGETLQRQRTDVRALTRTLVTGATSAVDASVRDADGRWEGCRSAFDETYASYRYRAQVRLDADAPDLPGALAPVVADLTPGDDSDPAKLRATRGDLEVSFWALPAGSQGALLLTVQGPCVDVPEDERDAWRDRREESPDPLAD